MSHEPFFIVGSPRSGTTLLRNILREHPDFISPEETFFYRWSEPFGTKRYENFLRNDPVMWRHRELDGCSEGAFWELYERVESRKELQDAYMEAFLKRSNQPDATWFDKTPQNTYALLLLATDYPDSKILHVHRNPMNVVASVRLGKTVGPESLRGAVNIWLEALQAAEAVSERFPGQVMTTAHEALTDTPQEQLNRILDFLGHDRMQIPAHLHVYPAKERFVEILTGREIDYVLSRCRTRMEKLDYPVDAETYKARHRDARTVTVKRRLARVRRRVTEAAARFLGRGPEEGLKGGFGLSADEGLLPTTSLYLRDALEDVGLGLDWHESRVASNTYMLNRTAVVVRYAEEAEWTAIKGWLAADERRQVIYVIDDDLPAMLKDKNMPAAYRERLQPFVETLYGEIVEAAATVVVPNADLQRLFKERDKSVVLLDPYWRIPALDELSQPAESKVERLSLVWLGTRSHLRDLAAVWPQIKQYLQQYPASRLTVYVGKHVPAWLERTPGIDNRSPLSWSQYRHALVSERHDIALCPTLATPVNQARSFSKFFELASCGAVPVMSSNVPFAGRLSHDMNCCLLGEDEWLSGLRQLTRNAEKRKTLAAAAHTNAVAMSRAAQARQVAFWRSALELP